MVIINKLKSLSRLNILINQKNEGDANNYFVLN